MNVSGQVLDPQGRPFHGARLVLIGRSQKPEDLGTSGADGRFTVKVPKGWGQGASRSVRPGAGLDFATIAGLNPARAVELPLVKDHVIHGKIVDTQGKPVAGVQVAVIAVGAFDGNSVDRFLSAWTNRMFSFQLAGRGQEPLAGTRRHCRGHDRCGRAVSSRGNGCGAARPSAHVGGRQRPAYSHVVNRPGFNATPYNETAPSRARSLFRVRVIRPRSYARAGTRLRG